VIEEQMPPGAAETLHHHVHARQFFYVLSGELTLVVDGRPYTLTPNEGLEIAPGEVHQAVNRSAEPVRFLLTSQPPSHDDRIEATEKLRTEN
jgi:mannose-6-phosphate isomerase-like protein (cupin superfamily)